MELWQSLSLEPWQIALIVLAGVAAGAINAVVGSGTLITFPALVAFGVAPVVSTMSNAVGSFPATSPHRSATVKSCAANGGGSSASSPPPWWGP